MTNLDFKVLAWQRHQSAIEQEMNRVNFLRQPLPPNMNPAELMKLVKVKCLKGFYDGKVSRERPMKCAPSRVRRHGILWP